MRLAFIFMLLFFTALPSVVRAEQPTYIEQIIGNHGIITQKGAGNSSTLDQHAMFGHLGQNAANIIQEGAGNSADVKQNGSRNDITLGQFGEGNSAQLGQYGFNLKSDVTQAGTGHGIIVNQFGIGGGPVIVRQH